MLTPGGCNLWSEFETNRPFNKVTWLWWSLQQGLASWYNLLCFNTWRMPLVLLHFIHTLMRAGSAAGAPPLRTAVLSSLVVLHWCATVLPALPSLFYCSAQLCFAGVYDAVAVRESTKINNRSNVAIHDVHYFVDNEIWNFSRNISCLVQMSHTWQNEWTCETHG